MNASDNSRHAPSERMVKTTSATGKDYIVIDDLLDFHVMTDADESALGEARHKTIGGRGIVGRLIDRMTK